MTDFTLCICTFKRPGLLVALLNDVVGQSVRPRRVVVVDGDPSSCEVTSSLRRDVRLMELDILYVPSSRGNLSFQRYLGWRASSPKDVILYLDDDIRLSDPSVLEKILTPFTWTGEAIVGVTAATTVPAVATFDGVLSDRSAGRERKRGLLQSFQESRRSVPGDVTRFGHRIAPVDRGDGYGPVKWLQGRVMAYRWDALDEGCFSRHLFALDQARCGLGEDTILSSRVGRKGEMLSLFTRDILHPDADLPRAYPVKAYRFGFAQAFSRRLIYQELGGARPLGVGETIRLGVRYLGNALLHWGRAIARPRFFRFVHATGYSLGAVAALFGGVSHRRLTPHIDWAEEARRSLAGAEIIARSTELPGQGGGQ